MLRPHGRGIRSAWGIREARVVAREGSARGVAAARTLERRRAEESAKARLGACAAPRQEGALVSDARLAAADGFTVPGVRARGSLRGALGPRRHVGAPHRKTGRAFR